MQTSASLEDFDCSSDCPSEQLLQRDPSPIPRSFPRCSTSSSIIKKPIFWNNFFLFRAGRNGTKWVTYSVPMANFFTTHGYDGSRVNALKFWNGKFLFSAFRGKNILCTTCMSNAIRGVDHRFAFKNYAIACLDLIFNQSYLRSTILHPKKQCETVQVT